LGLLAVIVALATVFELRRRVSADRRALDAQRAWFAAVTDHAAEYVLLLDERGRVTYASRAVERILGITPEEVIGADSLESVDPSDRAAAAEAFQRVLANPGEPVAAEYHARHRDGRVLTLAGTARNMLRDPAVRGIVVNVRDVSAERRIAAELQSAERQYREILDSLPLMVYSVEAASPFRPIYISRGHETLGFTREEWMMVPGLWEQTLHPEDRERVLRATESARERREPLVIEYRVLDKQGRDRWLLDRGRFTYDADGRPSTWDGVIIDVSERREAERALRESEERYRELFDEDVTANFISTASGRLLQCNQNFARLFGFESVEQALRADAFELHESREARTEWLRSLRRDGKITLYELHARRIDGAMLRLVSNARAHFDERGEITEIHGHLLDVTEQRRIEDQLRQSQKMESIGRLAGGIAHDFNNLLAIIGNYAALMRQSAGDGDGHEDDLGEILRAVERGSSLTAQLLTFSRERVPEVTAVDVDTAIGETERMLRRLLGPEILLTLELKGEGARVMMDRGHADQILLNLLLNASDAMPEGGPVVISTARVTSATAGECVRIVVRDSGIGMDADTVRLAVEPFFTTKPLGRGTGLGLSSVYGIVKQVGGELSIQSESGKGTSVTIHLPVVARLPGEPAREDAAPEARSGEPRALRVLVVDDEEGIRKTLARILTKRGNTVILAPSGAEALKAWDAQAGGFDLVVTDLRMPGMGGEELIRALRARGALVPVLAMSGYPEDQSRLPEMLDARVGFIEKPFSVGAIVARVRELTGGE
jgi:PAS domain S-box-containing protein